MLQAGSPPDFIAIANGRVIVNRIGVQPSIGYTSSQGWSIDGSLSAGAGFGYQWQRQNRTVNLGASVIDQEGDDYEATFNLEALY